MTTTLNILTAYTSKTVGNEEQHYTPEIGEPYRLTVEYEIKDAPALKGTAYFTMAGWGGGLEIKSLTVGVHKLSKEFFPFPLDGEIPYKVEIDMTVAPDKGSSGNPTVIVKTIEGTFTPKPPTQAIEFYDPQQVVGTQMQEFEFTPGKVDRLALMMSAPSSGSWQKLLSSSAKVKSGLSLQAGVADELLSLQPAVALLPDLTPVTIGQVYFWDRHNVPTNKIRMTQEYKLELRNQRVDANQLRKVTWSQMDATKGIDLFKVYTNPEKVIQSQDKNITAYVKAVLGADYRKTMSPYDAARKLFLAVLKHVKYYLPVGDEPDERPKTAVGMLEKGKGDCGGFSILLVAFFRNIGLPSRTACGAWIGTDAGHCWCEIYFPSYGWMVADGSGGNFFSEKGEFAFCFGNLHDLNRRMAVMRGNTFRVGDIHTSWLQCPLYPALWGTAKVAKYITHHEVSIWQQPKPPAVIIDPQFLKMGCPCREHGGFRIQSSANFELMAGK